MQYAGFWRRLGAILIDFAIFIPLVPFISNGHAHYRLFDLYLFLPNLLIGIAFNVFLVVRYGGTPGKIWLGMRIAMKDGAPVTTGAAVMRYSVMFLLGMAGALGVIFGLMEMTDAQYLAMDAHERWRQAQALAPSWYPVVIWAGSAWVWSEPVTMLLNRQKRALHDFIAGTVVVMKLPTADAQ